MDSSHGSFGISLIFGIDLRAGTGAMGGTMCQIQSTIDNTQRLGGRFQEMLNECLKLPDLKLVNIGTNIGSMISDFQTLISLISDVIKFNHDISRSKK